MFLLMSRYLQVLFPVCLALTFASFVHFLSSWSIPTELISEPSLAASCSRHHAAADLESPRVAERNDVFSAPISQRSRLPNNVYYVWCGAGRQLEFRHYLSMLNVIRFLQPDNLVLLHAEHRPVVDRYFVLLDSLPLYSV